MKPGTRKPSRFAQRDVTRAFRAAEAAGRDVQVEIADCRPPVVRNGNPPELDSAHNWRSLRDRITKRKKGSDTQHLSRNAITVLQVARRGVGRTLGQNGRLPRNRQDSGSFRVPERAGGAQQILHHTVTLLLIGGVFVAEAVSVMG